MLKYTPSEGEKNMNTKFIESSILVASILNVKNKYLDEEYVKEKELHYIKEGIQKVINSKNINAVIISSIDNIYYNIQDGIILCNKKNSVTKEDVYEHFSSYLIQYEIEKIIWNEEYIFELLIQLKQEELNKMQEIKTNYQKVLR